MKGRRGRLSALFPLLLCVLLCVTGCGEKAPAASPAQSSFPIASNDPRSYDSQDETALLMSADLEAGTLSFYNLNVRRSYTLSYDGTTRFSDRYGGELTPGLLSPGLIANVTFLKRSKHLNSLKVSDTAWNRRDITRYEIGEAQHTMKIGDQIYRFDEDLKVFSGGKKAELIDINPADCLSAWGLDTQVLSLSIDEGHGYLRLTGEEYFLGGWITVGDRIMARVTKGMLLAVPEGASEVVVENEGRKAVEKIYVKRNSETLLDLSDVEIQEVKSGQIIFTILPEDAVLKIDGKVTDYTEPVSLEYGPHRLELSAEGYESLTRYIRVAASAANISLELSPRREESVTETEEGLPAIPELPGMSVSGNTVSGNTVSGNGVSDSSMTASNPAITYITEAQVDGASDYRILLEAPEGVEAYLDGSYVGILPIDIAKVPGSHVITLRLEGYRTRSYTVEIDSTERDVSFSFAPLNPISN